MPRATIPAPTAGWNARDSIDQMAPDDAIYLDDYYPGDKEVRARNGHTSHATGLGSDVETLMSYGGATAAMFGIAGTSIFDVTSTGAVGAAVVTGLTNARWQYVNFGTSGAHFIWLCNGADAPYHYNSTSWANPTLTGVTAADIIYVAAHKRRLFFAFNDSLKFGYLAIDTVAGAVSEFNLTSLFTLGGELTAIGSWTRDGGAGPDDLAVFITSNGEVAIYAGADPASDWSLVGVFHIGRPIGRRPMIKVGADLIVITDAGFINLTSVLPTGVSAPSVALSHKISKAVREVTDLNKTRFGWQAMLYPQGGYGLFNIPVAAGGIFHQYVVNLTTGAWCRFKNQNAHCWCVHEGDLFFGGSTKVFQADNGLNDDGGAIEASGKGSFQYFGERGVLKRFTMLRPIIGSDGDLTVLIGFDVDYNDGAAVNTSAAAAGAGAVWDEAEWDEAEWASAQSVAQPWRTIQGIGYNAAIRHQTSTTEQTSIWYADDVIWQPGSGLT